MTQPFSSVPLQPTRAGQRRFQRPLASLRGCSLACLVAGCAERYDIGALPQQQLLETGDVAPGVGVLLADGVEDADAVLDGVTNLAGITPGDLDGDGFDDLIVTGTGNPSMMHILYGGPRPSDGVVRLAGRSSALGLDEYYYSPATAYPRQGDFDGDGANDLAVGVRDRGHYTYGLSGEAAAERDAALADLVQRWTEQRAFLWYGSPEPPARVEFPSDAVSFRAADDLSSHLARTLEERDPDEFEAQIDVELQLSWLGDVDGDGHGDLALSTLFRVTWAREESQSDAVPSIALRDRTECVSYLYYGGPQLEVGGEAHQPDARLRGFSLTGLGDVNGDGLADVTAVASEGNTQLPPHVFPGSAQRLVGEVPVQDFSVPVQIASLLIPRGVGDLDGDGIGDLLNARLHENQVFFDLVYGSPDLLQRPLDATRVSATFASRGQADMYDGGDYDGDGMSDLLLWKPFWEGDPYTSQPHSDQARLIPGSATRYAGTYDLDAIQPSGEPRSDEWTVLPGPAGDFDGDGRSDVLLKNFWDTRIKFGATLPSREELPGVHPGSQVIR
jgi:hypothetical protein